MDERVFEAMRPYFIAVFGNPASSSHAFGREAAAAVLKARNQLAALIGADQDDRTGAREIVFTSGATEANNLAIKGVLGSYRDKGRHIITQATEHKSVLQTCQQLAQEGSCELTVLPVDRGGKVDPAEVAAAIRPDTVLVSLMWANNETGVVLPVGQIGAVCRERGVLFHTDATQAAGKLAIDVGRDPVDLLSLSGHKFYGPKGNGALFVRRRDPRVRLSPLFHGGGHERGFRSGTLNVPGIVGLGMAADLCRMQLDADIRHLAMLRDRLEEALCAVGGVQVNGDPAARLPHVTNLSFSDVDGVALVAGLDDIAFSYGSACNSASIEASHVLRAMGVPPALASQSLRLSVGRQTTVDEVNYAAEKIRHVVAALRRKQSLPSACSA